ncbi:MAG: Ldh family oxidoreductase, partial [Acetobacteraceae bacterium]
MIRVPRYIAWLESGVLQRGQTITIVSEGPAHASLHGNSGFGQTIGPLAVDFGLAKARAMGVAVVGLRNAGHLGRIGEWGERAAEAGMVAIHFVNVANGAIVAPFGGVERMFSTNPVCIAVPSADGLLWTRLEGVAETTAGGRTALLAGAERLEEELGGLSVSISGEAFFQTNTEMAERLYAVAIEYAALKGYERLYDLYCGIGTIG